MRRFVGAARWIAPSAILALMPKCPMCLAGYVALWTGLGLSFPAAAWFRTILIALCIASLALVAAFRIRRLIAGGRRA
jgi:hypothetical protein